MLSAAPGIWDRYLDLVEAFDGEPGAIDLLSDLADYVAGLLVAGQGSDTELEACLRGLEAYAENTEGSEGLIASAFFDSLPPEVLEGIRPKLGSRCSAALSHRRLASDA